MAVQSLGSWFIEALTTDGAEFPTEGDWLEYLLTGEPPPLTVKVDADISATADDTQSARPTPLLSEATPITTAQPSASERINHMKKISQNTIDAIKRIEPDRLAALGVITKSKSSGYNCITCGNGSGKSGTGVIPKLEADGYHYICHCGASHDNIHLLAHHYGLDSAKDFSEICKRACDDFGIALEYDGDAATGNVSLRRELPASTGNAAADEARKRQEQLEREKAEKEAEMIRADIERASQNLHKLTEAERRGLTFEILEHFHCGCIFDWQSPAAILTAIREKKAPPPKSRRVIIPTSDRHYLASAIDRDKVPKRFHKMHAGKKELFNASAIDDIIAGKLIYRLIVVEGEYDAMSIWQVLKGIGVVAVGGVNENGAGNKYLIDALKARLDSGGGIKLPVDKWGKEQELEVVILYDDDKAGHGAAAKLLTELAALNIPAAEAYFPAAGDKKVDANQILQDKGDDELKAAVTQILCGDDVDNALKSARADIENRRQQERERQATRENLAAGSGDSGNGGELTDDLRDFIFNQITGNSDQSNALRFLALEGAKLRFLVNDETGCIEGRVVYSKNVWKIAPADKKDTVAPLITDAAIKLAAAARNDNEAKIVTRFQNQRYFTPILGGAESLTPENIAQIPKATIWIPDVFITRADLDNHPQLLNCRNGVVDLETGKLYDHNKSLLLTQKIDVDYRAGYRNGIVEKFLHDIQPDADDLLALQVFFGYCLTGEINVEKFLFLQGSGGNGKGTFTGAVLKLLGSYATPIPIGGILKNKNADANAATTALNPLIGKRLGISDEVPPNARTDLGTLKRLTGGDYVSFRRMYKEFGKVKPTWKLVFSGNDPLIIDDPNDPAFIRRFLYLPFLGNFRKNPDFMLKQKLDADDCRAGLLAWLVDGARWYYDHNNIYISSGMKTAAIEYRKEQDWLGGFIAEYCVKVEDATITLADFTKKLQEKCSEAARYSPTALREMIKKIPDIKYEPRHYDNATGKKLATIVGLGWLDTEG